MKTPNIISLLICCVLFLSAGCASSRPAPAPSPTVPPFPKAAPAPTPGAQKFEKTLAYMLVGNPLDPDKRNQAEMASQMDVGFSWWSSFQVVGANVITKATFTTRKSQLLTQEEVILSSGPAVIRKLELEVTEVPGVSGMPDLRTQELPLAGINAPEGLLLTARVEFLGTLGRPAGWIRLAEISRKADNLVLTWDVRF